MSDPRPISIEAACEFTTAQWPAHNYERHGYERVATWPNGRFQLDWHLYRKQIGE